jgi:hypothetical protein
MSQVTKPIALDETLQDVVTAIQGITQGGMIVSTGNVGSATQPVYINGGVPTAGVEEMPAYRASTFTTDANSAPNGFSSGNDMTNAPFTRWGTLMTYYLFDHTDYGVQFAFKLNSNDVWKRYKDGGAWGTWNRISGGIVTGTPTNVNSGLTLSSGDTFIKKSGNVVTFNIQCVGSISNGVKICDMPYTPIADMRFSILTYSGDVYGGYLSATKSLNNGEKAISSGFIAFGTYLTND